MGDSKLTGQAWKTHCTAKVKECLDRLEVFKGKLAKWQAMSKFDTQEQADKVRELHIAKARISKLEAELGESSK